MKSRSFVLAAFSTFVAFMAFSTVASATVPCIAFVHGHRGSSRLTTDSDQGGGYGYWYEHTIFSSDNGVSMVKAATNGFAISWAAVNYDSHVAYWTAAKEVAGDLNRVCSTGSWIVSHSMGGRVVSFIMGNSVSGDPNYNYGGAQFDDVRNKYDVWFSVGGAHDGTEAAEATCGYSSWACDVIASFIEDCDAGTASLFHSKAPQYENGTRISTYLISGYEAIAVASSCLNGEDDGVVEYGSSYFCNDHPADADNSVGYDRYCSSLEDVIDGSFLDGCGDDPSNKCKNNQKQRSGYKNYDAGHENHDDNRNNNDTGDNRRAVADGYWQSNSCHPISDDSCDYGWTGSSAQEIGWFVGAGYNSL